MKLRWLVVFFGCCGSLFALQPKKLRVDLIRNPQTFYVNGYVTNLNVEDEASTEGTEIAWIGNTRPGFSWQNDAKVRKQVGYRLLVASNRERLAEGKADVWDSGRKDGSVQTGIVLPVDLKPSTFYCWTVKVWSDQGESAYAEPQFFRTADSLFSFAGSYAPLERSDVRPIVSRSFSETTQLDFGKAAFGQIRMTCEGKEGDTLTVRVGERLSSDGRIDMNPKGTSIRSALYKIPLQNGRRTYRVTWRPDRRNTGAQAIRMSAATGEVYPFRYVETEGGTVEPTSVVRETVYYPFDDTATDFVCSDDDLNRIWKLCKHTVKATSFAGIYIDGDRERIPYEADALINQLSHYAVDAEFAMARRSCEYLIFHPTWPTEWILQTLTLAWNDYLYTGDDRLLRHYYDDLKSKTLLALRDESGLISTSNGRMNRSMLDSIHFSGGAIRDIVDWPHVGRLGANGEVLGEIDGFRFCRYNAVVNAWFYRAVSQMARIAVALNKPDAGEWKKLQEQVYVDYNRQFFDRRRGVYRDGDTTQHASLHTQMFALDFGLVPDKHRDRVATYIRSRGMACSVYGAQFLLDALYDHRMSDYALSLMLSRDDRGWLHMMEEGSTMTLEAWAGRYKSNLDWNHAWGTAPANVIVRKLMGIEPETPGFATFRVAPRIGMLTFARLNYATIRGDIGLSVDRSGEEYSARLSVPANSEALFVVPDGIRTGSVVCDGAKQKNRCFRLSSGEHLIQWKEKKEIDEKLINEN